MEDLYSEYIIQCIPRGSSKCVSLGSEIRELKRAEGELTYSACPSGVGIPYPGN